LALVVLIASFSVIGVIMMVVSSKRKDIALLQSMGMKKDGVRSIFLRQGMWIGIVGSALGCLIGSGVCVILMHLPIRLPESYYVETLVVNLRPLWVAGVALLGVAMAMCAAIYPLREAVRQDPITALRYE
jgi:lipoprotein-releasing system permease protein